MSVHRQQHHLQCPQIEGPLIKILANRDLNGMTIDVQSVARSITDMYKGGGEALPTPSLIISETARFYQVEESVLRGTKKTKGTAKARQVAMYLCRRMTNISFPDIGQEFGKHTRRSCMPSRRWKSSLPPGNQHAAKEIDDIIASINARL